MTAVLAVVVGTVAAFDLRVGVAVAHPAAGDPKGTVLLRAVVLVLVLDLLLGLNLVAGGLLAGGARSVGGVVGVGRGVVLLLLFLCE